MGMTIQDHRSTRDALQVQVTGAAATTAASLERLIAREVRQLEVTAATLLAGAIDRRALDEASPFTESPLSAVIDVARREFLGLSVDDIDTDLDVTLDQALVALPNLQHALDGEVALSHLVFGGPEEVLASVAVPYRAADGSRRVYATGFDLRGSPIAVALADGQEKLRHRLVDRNGDVLVGTPRQDSDDLVATSPVRDTDWQVETSAGAAELDPSSSALAGSLWVQLVAIVVGMSIVTALWTRSVRNAEEVALAYQRLTRAAHHQREATAIMTHELRSPIARAHGMSTVLARKWDDLTPDKRHEMVQRLNRSTDALAHLIDDMQVVVTSSAALLTDDSRSPVALDGLLDTAVASLNGTADVDRSGVVSGLWVFADEPMAHALLRAVLDNATTHGGGRIELSAVREDDRVRIDVRDHGAGVDPAFADQLFEPFTQEVGHMDRVRGGLGVGLALARNLATGLGGTIAHQPADPGARFIVHLLAAEMPYGGHAPGPVPDAAPLHGDADPVGATPGGPTRAADPAEDRAGGA